MVAVLVVGGVVLSLLLCCCFVVVAVVKKKHQVDSKEKALEAYHSEEYKLALEHALVSSNRFVVIVEGV